MYGITGVPSLVLFHNGKPIAKYNGTDYTLYEFTKFVIRHTGRHYNLLLNYIYQRKNTNLIFNTYLKEENILNYLKMLT